MKRVGYADLPLHYGRVPAWLYERMTRLGGAIVEAIVEDYGKSEVLRRLSDPLWFQSLGCVLGMDWHSSGITTSVLGALKQAINPISRDLGIYVCGGRGKHSRKTPDELLKVGEDTGLDGEYLVRCSRLSAKTDNTALQDGFQIYLHSFIVTDEGEWAVVQQGLNDNAGMARRYHWYAPAVRSFVEEPHSGVVGRNQGLILNLTHRDAAVTRDAVVEIAQQEPFGMLADIKKIVLPKRHEVAPRDVDLKRLGAVLALAYETQCQDFETLLLVRGLGPRTLQSLALVSEVIHGTPTRFTDPARYSFAHGGKDRHPFPVPLKVYDKTIEVLRESVNRAKMGYSDKQTALKGLATAIERVERDFAPVAHFEELVEKEKRESYQYGGRSVFGEEKPPGEELKPPGDELKPPGEELKPPGDDVE